MTKKLNVNGDALKGDREAVNDNGKAVNGMRRRQKTVIKR